MQHDGRCILDYILCRLAVHSERAGSPCNVEESYAAGRLPCGNPQGQKVCAQESEAKGGDQ